MPTTSLLAVYQELRSDWSAREPIASTMGGLGRAAWSEWATEGDTFGLELPYPTWAKTVTADLVKVGPKGYIHGWIKIGPSAVGDLVHHPEHGHGKVTRVGSKTVGVQFHSGAYHAFEHGGVGEGHFVSRVTPGPAKRIPAVTPAMPTPAEHYDRLHAMSSRDEGRQYVAGIKGKELRALADHLSVSPGTVGERRDGIVESAVGARLDSQAIRGGNWLERTRPAQRRQAAIDQARPIAELAARLDEHHHSLGDDTPADERTRVLSHVVDAGLSDVTRSTAGDRPADGPGMEALRQSPHDRVAADARAFAGEHGVTLHGSSGDVVPFNPAKHKAIDGDVRTGTPVEVLRPGTSMRHGDETILLSKADVFEADKAPTPPKRQPLPGLRVAKLEHGDHVVWEPPGEAPVHGTVRREGKGKRTHIDWDNGRSEPVSRAGREPNMRMATDEERAERAATGENPNDRATRLAMHAEGSTLDPAVYRRALVAPITEAAAAMATDAHNGASPRAVAHRVRTAHNRHRDIVDRMGWADRFDDIAATAESGDVAGAQQKMGDLAAAADVRLGAMPGDVVPFGDEHEPLGEIRAGGPAQVHRPATYFTAGGREYLHERGQAMPAPTVSTTIPVDQLKHGDYAEVVGEDQYGKPITLRGYVSQPTGVRIGARGRKKRDAVAVQVTETPGGANGWRGVAYVAPGTHVTPLSAPAATAVHVGPDRANADLARRVATGVEESSAVKPRQGVSAEVRRVRLGDGSTAYRKVAYSGETVNDEYLATRVAQAVGVPVPAVHRANDRTLFLEDIKGQHARDAGLSHEDTLNHPDARLIGLADALTGVQDRRSHGANHLVTSEGRIVAIDNAPNPVFDESGIRLEQPRDHAGAALPVQDIRGANPFAEQFIDSGPDARGSRPKTGSELQAGADLRGFETSLVDTWRQGNNLKPEEAAAIRQRLEALRPEFGAVGREERLDYIKDRLDAIAAHSRYAPPAPSEPLKRSMVESVADAHGTALVPGDTITIASNLHNRTDQQATVLDVGTSRVGGHHLATVRFADGVTEQVLPGNVVRARSVESAYLTNLARELEADPRFTQPLRGKPATSEVLRTLAGAQRGRGYESAALQQEARRHRGTPLGDRLATAAGEVELLRRGNASPEMLARAMPAASPAAAPTASPRMQAEALHVEAAARQRALDAGLPATGSTSRPHHVPAGPVGTGRGATAAGWLQRIAEQQQVDELRSRAEQVAATPVSAPEVTRAAEDRILAMDRPGAPAHIRETAAGIRERRTAIEPATPTFHMPADVDQRAVTDLRAQFDTHSGTHHTTGEYDGHLSSALGNPDYSPERRRMHDLAQRIGEPNARRVAWEADAEHALGAHLQRQRPDDPNADPYADLPPITPAEMAKGKADAERELKARFADKKIVVRARPGDVANIVRDGRMKNAFETGRSGGDSKSDRSYRDRRAKIEHTLFGIPTDADPSTRPIYAHLTDGVNSVDPDESGMLASYGDVQIVLKDAIRPRTTASVGDSIDDKVLPSPIDNPKWYSTNHVFGRYDEAQIHGGVKTSDIAEVVFPSQPDESLRRQLDGAGVPWRVASASAPQSQTRITIAPRGGRMPVALKPPPAPRPAAAPKPPKLPPTEAAQQALQHIRAGGQTDATLKALPVAALRELARLHGIVGSIGGRDNVKRMRKPDLIREMTPWLS